MSGLCSEAEGVYSGFSSWMALISLCHQIQLLYNKCFVEQTILPLEQNIQHIIFAYSVTASSQDGTFMSLK